MKLERPTGITNGRAFGSAKRGESINQLLPSDANTSGKAAVSREPGTAAPCSTAASQNGPCGAGRSRTRRSRCRTRRRTARSGGWPGGPGKGRARAGSPQLKTTPFASENTKPGGGQGSIEGKKGRTVSIRRSRGGGAPPTQTSQSESFSAQHEAPGL